MSQDERKNRLAKLARIKEQGINPYPSRFDKKNDLKHAFESKIGTKVKVAGRVMTFRDMGKLCFGHLMDETRKMQFALQADKLDQSDYKWFVKNIKHIIPSVKFISNISVAPHKIFCDHEMLKDKKVMLKNKIIKDFNLHGLSVELVFNQI